MLSVWVWDWDWDGCFAILVGPDLRAENGERRPLFTREKKAGATALWRYEQRNVYGAIQKPCELSYGQMDAVSYQFLFRFRLLRQFRATYTYSTVPLAAGVDAGRSSDGNKKDGSAANSSVCLVRAAVASGRTASIAPSLSHDGRRNV